MCVCVRETSNEEEVFDLKESKEPRSHMGTSGSRKGKRGSHMTIISKVIITAIENIS